MMKKLYIIILLAVASTIVNAQCTKLLDFSGTANGSYPYGSVISDGTFLYGMTYNGGANNYGTIYKIKTDGTGYSKLYDFAGGTDGSNPFGDLFYDGTFFYGMTGLGGTSNAGTIFKIKNDGTGYSIVLNFSSVSPNGYNPHGSLISVGTFLYGMTYSGGTNNYGTIFKIKKDGTGDTTLLNFVGNANGKYPYGSLFYDGTFLYGMTNQGGTNNIGVVFKIMPDGTGYSKLLDFTGTANGSYPRGSLISDGTFLYGITYQGGSSGGVGTIFKIMPNGTGYSKLFNFSPTTANYPYGSLFYDGTFLYGTASLGGANSDGILFKIKNDGTGFSNLLNFSGTTNGSNPRGSLFYDGTFLYGMTYTGGINNMGVIFKYQDSTTTSIAENNVENSFNVSPNPFSTQTVLQTDNPLHNATLTVDNCFGQTVAQIKNINGQTITFNRDNLQSGLYFVQLTEEGKPIAAGKLIITND